MKLSNTFFLIVLTMLLLAGLVTVHPENGIKVTSDIRLQFPTWEEIFEMKDLSKQEEVTSIIEEEVEEIEQLVVIDSTEIRRLDSLQVMRKMDSLRNWQLKLHYKNDDKSILYAFFDKLLRKSKNRKIRIVHYGDSQIEGDRITSFFRHKLQDKFGGNGPGLLAPVPLVHNFGINQSYSESWKRYTRYGFHDSLIIHRRYGALASFGRFAPPHTDTTYSDTLVYEGTLTFKRRNASYSGTKYFKQLKLFYGYNTKPVQVQLYANGELLLTDTLKASESSHVFKYHFKKSPKKVEIKFLGNDSPDVFAVSLEGDRGINVDNIALRGSSGTLFKRITKSTLTSIYNEIKPDLILMQFGGNVMPYIDNDKESKSYARKFARTLNYMRGMNPNASIIVIGPSDMSYLNKTKWVTYPMLPTVVEDLKQAAFNSGAAYWDIFQAMGAENSMPVWVDAQPPLAAKDHIHFSRKGARKVAHWFYNAIVRDFNEYIILNSQNETERGDTLQVVL